MEDIYKGPPGLNQEKDRAKTRGRSANDEASHAATAAPNGNEKGTVDEPQGHEEPKTDTVPAGNTIYVAAASFEELPLSTELKQGLYTEMNFQKPSWIQAKTLPMILQHPYKSLVAQAHNGSGKTTCFALAMLSRVDPTVQQPQALCLCPTRELVAQNVMVLEKMGKFTKIGVNSTISVTPASRHRVTEQVMVGTHGILKKLHEKRILKFQSIRIMVFDEADEMLKLHGFADDSERLVRKLRRDARPQSVQFLLFSATFNESVKDFALRVITDNGREEVNQVFVPREDLSLDVIKQYQVECPTPLDKILVLEEMIFPQCEKLGQTIIFVRTKEIARTLHLALEKAGHRCTSIRGDLDHQTRDRVVNEFRTGITKVLISTDVLSRGFDVTQVTLVINYEVPVEKGLSTPAYETYLHRIGRSGRFGRKGAAFNLVSGAKEKQILDSISEHFEVEIPEVPYYDEDAFLDALKEAGLTDG